jgi:integrase
MPEPWTNKTVCVEKLNTGNRREAEDRSHAPVAVFKAMIAEAWKAARPEKMVWYYYTKPTPPYQPFISGLRRDLVTEAEAARREAAEESGRPMIDVTPTTIKVYTYEQLIQGWKLVREPPLSSENSMRTGVRKLQRITKHDNAEAVTPEDLIALVEQMLNDGLSHATVKNQLAMVKSAFKIAKRHRKISANPGVDVSFEITKKGAKKTDFTREEMVRILDAARKSDSDLVRWAIPLTVYCGARVGEISEATTHDFEQRDDMLVLHIREDNRDENQTLKTDESERRFPLHQAVLDAGFAAYLDSLPPGPLFPKVTANRTTGKRSRNAGDELNDFLRYIGVFVEKKKTFHSLRHSFETMVRDVDLGIREGVSDYLTGRAKKNQSDKYGDHALSNLRAAMAKIPADPMKWKLD